MRQFAAIFLLASGFVLNAEAQSFTDRLRAKKQGEGTVTVTQSAAIDELVNNAKLTILPQTKSVQPQSEKQNQHQQHAAKPNQQHNDKDSAAKKQETSIATQKKNIAEEVGKEHQDASKQPETDTEQSDLGNVKKVPRVNRKVTGYRVQAYAGGNSRADRQKAENIKNAIKARYPELPVYVHFYSPRWICRVGNFRTFEEAGVVLKNIKAMGYKQACIVKGKINVGY